MRVFKEAVSENGYSFFFIHYVLIFKLLQKLGLTRNSMRNLNDDLSICLFDDFIPSNPLF